MEVDSDVEVGVEVEVEAVTAVAGGVATVRLAVMMAVWEAGRRQLQRVRRAGCGLAVGGDGDACNSWDRCGRCMAAQPVRYQTGQ